jgi:hypothetical protein
MGMALVLYKYLYARTFSEKKTTSEIRRIASSDIESMPQVFSYIQRVKFSHEIPSFL